MSGNPNGEEVGAGKREKRRSGNGGGGDGGGGPGGLGWWRWWVLMDVWLDYVTGQGPALVWNILIYRIISSGCLFYYLVILLFYYFIILLFSYFII